MGISTDSLILNWFLSQNGKAHKGFTCNQIYKGIKINNDVCFLTIYRNIKKLKDEQLLRVIDKEFPLKFALSEKFKN